MTYAAGEALLLTQIQAATGFNASNSSRGVYTILNSGNAKSYAILRPGPFAHRQKALGGLGEAVKYETDWTTVCELFCRLKDYGETLAELVARRQEIIGRFDAYPRAGDTTNTIEDVAVVSATEPVEVAGANGVPIFIKQDLTIIWTEVNSVTLQE